VDNPAQVKGAVKEAFKHQAEPISVTGDVFHAVKRVMDELDPSANALSRSE
jgi:shikimate 5-dehydrogenase